MRTHVLLILVVAILATSGCSARRGGSWWPFSGNRYVESGDLQSQQWAENVEEFPVQATPATSRPRSALLNPFRRATDGDYLYEQEVVNADGCRDCGATGKLSGRGYCDDCLEKTDNQVLGSNGNVIEPAGEPFASSNARQLRDGRVPNAPDMERYQPGKLVRRNAVVTDRRQVAREMSDWKPQKFQPVQSDFSDDRSTRSDSVSGQPSPQVPTTVIQDQRMNQYQSPIPNWEGWDGTEEGAKPARIVNRFNDDVDWSNLPQAQSIAMPNTQKIGGEPAVQAKPAGNKRSVVEIQPDQLRGILFPASSQEDPEFEQFTLDDLFPADMQPALYESAMPDTSTPETVSKPVVQTPTTSESATTIPAKSILEEDTIEWGLPNQPEPKTKNPAPKSDKPEYSLVDENDPDYQSEWDEEQFDEEAEYEREQRDSDLYEDESLYEDEDGVYDEDADFSQSGNSGLESSNLSSRSEKDIIQELRNSVVPDRVVFDYSKQESKPSTFKPYKPVTLSARPVPHYQELLHLARMKEEGAVDMSGASEQVDKLPATGKTPAIPVSSQRVVEEAEEFNFQPLPNLVLPTPLGVDELDMGEFEDQAFDPDVILNATPTEVADQVAKPMEVPVQMVEGSVKRNAVPIILKAAPTFDGQGNEAEADPVDRSNARIRFIKPSYQRKLDD